MAGESNPENNRLIQSPLTMPSPSKRFIVNASWLIKLRWVAAIGQLITIFAVIFWLRIKLPMVWALLTIILVTAFSNLILSLMFSRWFRTQERRQLPWDQVLGIVMVMDMLSLTALLFASGGPSNPFNLFFFVNLSLSALILNRQWAWWLNSLAFLCFALLLYDHFQMDELNYGLQLLPVRQTGQLSLTQMGLFVAFATCASVIVYFMTRLTAELHQQQLDLNAAQQRQAKSEKIEALGTLAAGAAHELATPLSTIAVVARDVEKAFDDHPPDFPGAEEVLEDVHLIRSQLDRCRKILDRMSSHAGETVGEAFQSVSMRQLANEVLNELLENDQIDLNLPDDHAVKTITVPLDSICQALRGLVQNALDVSEGRSRVEVNISQNSKNWLWRIIDSGEGMSPDVLQRVSEPFFTTKPPGQGMGLGLFLAKNVIHRLDGDINIQSEPGRGTVVTVQLPISSNASETC
ncbi:MAG: ATP-binding protein [Planctomycetota bacterium]